MKSYIKPCLILFIAVCIGWNLKKEYRRFFLSDLTLNNIEALAESSESTDECEGCMYSLYFCKFYGDWGGCLGTATIFEV